MSEAPPKRTPSLLLPVLAAGTLGLAPFVPEPHIVGKIRWVLGGANGMEVIDWLDLVWHGAPWVWLGVALVWTVLASAYASFRQPE